MVAVYTHGFPMAEQNFEKAGVKLVTLTDYDQVIEEALRTGYISAENVELLREWRKSPETWGI